MFCSKIFRELHIQKLPYYSRIVSRSKGFEFFNASYSTEGKCAPDSPSNNGKRNLVKIAAAVGIGSSLCFWLKSSSSAESKSSVEQNDEKSEKFGERVPLLPEYTSEEVAKHNSEETGVWISNNHGVYDITSFIKQHPGGSASIMLGAGSSVEPFWALYAIHKKAHVLHLLEKYRIGNLAIDDVETTAKDSDDPFSSEPKRHRLLKPSSLKPFNAEPPLSLLAESLLTPNDFFYVRNHLPVPEVDPKSFELEVEGLGIRTMTLKLDELKKLPKYTITAAIQCGGNRRSEMAKVKPVKGLSWGQAAISNAEWSGVRLSDVLESAGLKKETNALHVQFEGLDLDATGNPYGASIPIDKAIDPRGDVILAYEMNGEELLRDHGYPVRLVAPGIVGARSVKWLSKIVVSKDESPSHWQQNDYKGFGPNVDWDTVDFTKSPAIQDTPVTSAICQPTEGQAVKIKDGMVRVKGYAYSGGGRKIIRMDVSADGGKTWKQADKLESDMSQVPRAWGWTIWTAYIPVPKDKTELELVSKAVDSGYNTQPENFDNIWNLRGVLSNAYHRVKVKVKKM